MPSGRQPGRGGPAARARCLEGELRKGLSPQGPVLREQPAAPQLCQDQVQPLRDLEMCCDDLTLQRLGPIFPQGQEARYQGKLIAVASSWPWSRASALGTQQSTRTVRAGSCILDLPLDLISLLFSEALFRNKL